MIISRSVLRRLRNVLDKSCRENQNPHFVFSNIFFFENRAVYEIIWKNIVQPGRKAKATNTHSDYVIFIAFLLQQWLRERASMLRHTWPTVLVLYRYANTPRLSVKVLAPKTRITVYFRFSQRCSYWLNSWDLQCQLVNSYRRFEDVLWHLLQDLQVAEEWTAPTHRGARLAKIKKKRRIVSRLQDVPSGVQIPAERQDIFSSPKYADRFWDPLCQLWIWKQTVLTKLSSNGS